MPHPRLLGGCKDSAGIAQLLNRKWFLSRPDTLIQPVLISGKPGAYDIDGLHFSSPKESKRFLDTRGVFHVIRDDLLHPLMGGNKLRKLDALLPLLQSASVTDVITCGGCQSGHAAAMAVACAESGIRAHLLLRGERLLIPTGYNLISGMYGEVIYIPRSEYAERDGMFTKYARSVAGGGAIVQVKGTQVDSDDAFEHSHSTGIGQTSKTVAVVKEGTSDVIALLGLIRLVDYLSQPRFFGSERRLQIVVDCGTGTTAIGVALAILILRLPWKVIGIMLVGALKNFKNLERRLLDEFKDIWHSATDFGITQKELETCLEWVNRPRSRKFGNVLEGEIQTCQKVARETGILVDPIYTLAAWEVASNLAFSGNEETAMLHTGGTMSLFGLAQRYPSQF